MEYIKFGLLNDSIWSNNINFIDCKFDTPPSSEITTKTDYGGIFIEHDRLNVITFNSKISEIGITFMTKNQEKCENSNYYVTSFCFMYDHSGHGKIFLSDKLTLSLVVRNSNSKICSDPIIVQRIEGLDEEKSEKVIDICFNPIGKRNEKIELFSNKILGKKI